MKDIKHIRWDLYLVAWVMFQGREWGTRGNAGGGVGVKNLIFPKFKRIWCLGCSHECHVQCHIVLIPGPCGLRKGQKVNYH